MKYHRNNVPRAYHKMNPTRYWKALLAPNQAAADKIIASDAEALWKQYGVRFVKSYDPASDRYKVKQLVAVSEYTHNESHVPCQIIRASDTLGKPYLFSEKKSVQVQRRTQPEVTSELEANHTNNRL